MADDTKSPKSPVAARAGGLGARLGIGCFFFFFFAMGSVFCVFLGREVWQRSQSYLWPRHECTVIASQVRVLDTNEDPYAFEVAYEYEVDGQAFTGEQYLREPSRFDLYEKAGRLVARFPAGRQAHCWVNPGRPGQAVLAHQDLWLGLFIFLPLIFVAIGAGGLYAAVTGKGIGDADKSADAPISDDKPLSKGVISTKQAQWARRGLGAALFLAGAAVTIFVFGPHVLHLVTSRNWPSVPCRVIHSRLQEHVGDESTSYSIDVLYEYEFAGQTYRSNRYRFLNMASSGRDGKRDIMKQYPVGAERQCWVNPGDPTLAVLNRDVHAFYLLGLLPIALTLGGVALMLHRSRRLDVAEAFDRPPERTEAGRPVVQRADRSPKVLKAKASPLAKLIGMIVFCLFWNGIVSVFIFVAVKDFRRDGGIPWFMLLFLTPFVLIGLGIVWGVIYQFLALFNPRIQVRLTPGDPRLGEPCLVQWRFLGRPGRIRRLEMRLEGYEEASYRVGTTTTTDKVSFWGTDICVSDDPRDFGRGQLEVTIPATKMHSFEATHNKILWSIHVKGDVPFYPDVEDEFPVIVLPPEDT